MSPYEAEMWELANATARFSKDPSTKVGCVAAVNKRVVGTGRNGFPAGIDDEPELYNNRAVKLELVTHAEANLVAICGNRLQGADVFVTFPPCNDCAQLLITAGIRSVYTREYFNPESIWHHRWELSKTMFHQVGIMCFELDEDGSIPIFRNSIPKYQWVYDAVMALHNFKDV